MLHGLREQAAGVIVAKAKAATAEDAARAIAAQAPADGVAMALVFVSPTYDPHAFTRALGVALGAVPIFGCTTAGELSPDGWGEDSVVAMFFLAEDFMIAARALPDLANFRIEDGQRQVAELRETLLRDNAAAESETFGLLLIDGMCRREEMVMSVIYTALGGIPVVGGSAGDGLRFGATFVFYDGAAHSDAAILILVRTRLPFRLFKCDNFEPTATKMVVTQADVERRI